MVGTPPPVDIDIQDFHLDALKLFHFPSYFTKRKQLNDIKKLVDSRELKVPSPIIFRYIGQRFNLIDKLNGDENDESFFTSFNKRHRKDFEDAVQDDDGGFFNYQLTEDTIDGVLCYKISRDVVNSLFADRVVSVKGRELTGKEKIEFLRTTRLKGHQIYWFDKLHGNIIRKMTMQSERVSPDVNTAANYPIERELTNKLSQETKSGIWYPSSWVCSVSCAGKLERREEGIIEYKSINQPIPAERFSLENIAELRPNCPVEWNLDSPPPGKGKLICDGKKIVGLGFDNDSYEAAKRKHHIAFIVLANVLIISTLIFVQFLRVWNRRRNDNL
ncbi:hypothetical protein FACS18942_06840 [Planctomycetales bacterium]|nr:hypothetical protein FACS18942_06840 [Planctomycetales bacterium]